METLKKAWEKLKVEWKSFVLQVSMLIASGWELAAQMGADLPSLFNFIPEQFRSVALFGFAMLLLLARKYTP